MRIRDERGNASLITALAGLPLMLAAGAAIDYAGHFELRSELQQAADAAALTGTITKNDTDAERRNSAASALAANFTRSNYNPTATYVFDGAKSTVTATVAYRNAFMQLAGIDSSDITVRAVAYSGLSSPVCMLSLEPAATKAVQINSGSSIEAPDCAIQVNSTDHEALFANSGSLVSSEATCVVGNYRGNAGSRFRPTPETSCPPLSDPLASLQPPAEAADPCSYDDVVVQSGENRSFAPGVYCQKFLVQGGARATFEPGTHVMQDAELVVNSGGRLYAVDAMIYFRGGRGRMNANSGSEIDLRAPRAGPYAGIAVFQDRNAVTAAHIVNSESTSRIEGVMYTPNNDVLLNSGSRFGQTSPWWAVVARKIETNSGSHIYFNVDYAASDIPVPAGLAKDGDVRLTE